MNSRFNPLNPVENEYEDLFESGMTEIERLHSLQSEVRQGGDVIRELGLETPFGQYIAFRKRHAASALVSLYSGDCNDAPEIARGQQVVREYLMLIEWVSEKLQAANLARDTLANEYGPEPENNVEPEDEGGIYG